jgi:hypothetical protein
MERVVSEQTVKPLSRLLKRSIAITLAAET